MSLLSFSQASIDTQVQESPVLPQKQAPKPEPFTENQHYTLTGGDVYQAKHTKVDWKLKNINKSFGNNHAGLFVGYLWQAGVMYKLEYDWEFGRSRIINRNPVDVLPANFQQCGVKTTIIKFSEE